MDVIRELRAILSKEGRAKNGTSDQKKHLDQLDTTMEAIQLIESSSDADGLQQIFERLLCHFRVDDDAIDLSLFGDLLMLQYEFYQRSNSCTEDQAFFYRYIADNPREYFNAMINQGAKPEVTLTFKMNMLAPVQHTLRELELFNRAVKVLLKLHATCILKSEEGKSSGIAPLLLFCAEMAENKKSVTNKLAGWRKCLQVYDWHTQEKLSKTDISKKLGSYKEHDKPNSLKEVRELLAEATRLIKSATDGSFPL